MKYSHLKQLSPPQAHLPLKFPEQYLVSLDRTTTNKLIHTLPWTGVGVFLSGISDQSQKKALQLLHFGSSGKQSYLLNHFMDFHISIYLSLFVSLQYGWLLHLAYGCCLHDKSFYFPFIFNLLISLNLKCISYRQHTVESQVFYAV